MSLPNDIKQKLDIEVSPIYYEDGFLNLESLCKDKNVKVLEAEFKDNNVSGVIMKDSDTDWTIYLNQKEAVLRKRFTVAHELGHYFAYQFQDTEAIAQFN